MPLWSTADELACRCPLPRKEDGGTPDTPAHYTEQDDGSRGNTAVLSYPYEEGPAKFNDLVYAETIAPVVSAGFFATRERTADATAFADGVTSIFATGLDISQAALHDYGGG